MADEVFYLVLNMSLASCVVIAVLLLLRLLKPLPRRFFYPLWALAFFRLTVPFAPAAGWSLFNFTGDLVKRLISMNTYTHGSLPLSISENLLVMNMLGAAESYSPLAYKTESLRQTFITGAVVWAIIAAAALISVFLLYWLTHRELKKAVLLKGNIYCSDMLLSPVLAGVFRPRIILPPGLDPDTPEGQMILAHENVHRKRLDNLWRTLAVIIACIHWFNPLVWVMLREFFSDLELSCDEAVFRQNSFSGDDRRKYASTILQFAEDKKFLISSAFGRYRIKVRIMKVLNYKRMTVIGAVASAIFLLALALVLITNPTL